MHQPHFINFEGIDKCGKDTQADLLYEKMIELGRSVEFSSEPTKDSEAGQRIWRILQHQEAAPVPQEMQFLYITDRAEHVSNLIAPTLSSGKSLIEVRYLFSTLAYGVAFG
ncbi:MAG: dTMP kinase, partial [Candidatus Komeilibacteria bacterium CG_4_9_14_3_um_filter_37_5]